MADIAPLWPLRYDASLLEEVVAPPYDVIDGTTRKALGERHPHNVAHIDLPAGEGIKRYERAQGLFSEWQEMGVVVRDEAPAYWRYAQTFTPIEGGARVTRKGFFALIRAVPYSERVVLPHERADEAWKLDRIQLCRATRAVLSPQFMLYADPARALDAWLDTGEAFADFSTPDGVRHQFGRVSARDCIDAITAAFADRTLLIADGHHSYEAAVAISEEFEAEAVERGIVTTPRSEHRFTLAFLANGDDPNLKVAPIHRVVHSLPSFSWNDLLTQARVLFDVVAFAGNAEELWAHLARQTRPAIGAMTKGGKAALLLLRGDADLAGHPVLGGRSSALRDTVVALLHDGLLEYALGMSPEDQALKTNLRYVEEPAAGAALLESGDGQVLFLLNATPIAALRHVAAAGEVMPPKSTDFYPKVPTGLCFHTLYPDRLIP